MELICLLLIPRNLAEKTYIKCKVDIWFENCCNGTSITNDQPREDEARGDRRACCHAKELTADFKWNSISLCKLTKSWTLPTWQLILSIFDEESYKLIFLRISSIYGPTLLTLSSYCMCAGMREKWLVSLVYWLKTIYSIWPFELLDLIGCSVVAPCAITRRRTLGSGKSLCVVYLENRLSKGKHRDRKKVTGEKPEDNLLHGKGKFHTFFCRFLYGNFKW